MPVGVYDGSVMVNAAALAGSPIRIPVRLTINPPLAAGGVGWLLRDVKVRTPRAAGA